MNVASPTPGLRALIVLALVAGCQSPAEPEREVLDGGAGAEQRLERLIDGLYEAFSFDAGGGPDASFLKRSFAEGATFVSPPSSGKSPVGVNAETFLADFESYIQASPLRSTGYHERVIWRRVDMIGSIAHAWVTFEGFVPGEEPDRRGIDSLQFVLDGSEWKLVSFTTQYESEAVPIPRQFLPTMKLPTLNRRSPWQWPDAASRSRSIRTAR